MQLQLRHPAASSLRAFQLGGSHRGHRHGCQWDASTFGGHSRSTGAQVYHRRQRRQRRPQRQTAAALDTVQCPGPQQQQEEQSQPQHQLQGQLPAETAPMPYVSPLNANVPPARPGEFAPLQLGQHAIWPPVGLAPMAGITNAPFRAICAAQGAPLCISEMLAAGLLNEGNAKTRAMARFGPYESPQSVQLYGVEVEQVRRAAAWLVDQGAQHIDLNFGCPVRKVTAKGGGAAIPARPRLLGQLVAAAVAGARGRAPVTVKMRIGLSDGVHTYLEAGRVAEAEGAAALSLHARTAAQLYDPPAAWDAISRLVAAVSIPVLGNGDVFEAGDALRLMRQTGAAGVLVGRGVLGRPWLFAELADVFDGRPPRPPPPLSGALQAADEHLHALLAWEQHGSELGTLRAFRKLVPLYLHGFASATRLRQALLTADSLTDWQAAIAMGEYDPAEPFNVASLRHARLKGTAGGDQRRISLPPGWLEDQQVDKLPLPGAGVSCEG